MKVITATLNTLRYRNGTLLRATGKVNAEMSPDGVCTLTITECAVTDEGIYRCDAENPLGKARTQSTVRVESKS